jgi:hypothetical protein
MASDKSGAEAEGDLVSLASLDFDLDATSAEGAEGASGPVTSTVLGGLNRMGEMAGLLGSEPAEKAGSFRGKKEAAVISRFDPDLILGSDGADEKFEGISIRDLFEGLTDLKPNERVTEESLPDDAAGEEPALPDLPPESKAGGVDAVPAEELLAGLPDLEIETEPEDGGDDELAAAALLAAAERAARPDGGDAPAPDADAADMAALFAEVREPERGASDGDPGGEGRREQLFQSQPKRDGTDAPQAALKSSRRAESFGASGALAAAGDSDAGETAGRAVSGSFSSELASAMASRGEQTAPSAAASPASPPPGATTVLNPEAAFGDGLTNVLEFMKNDGMNQARIVVEPPALGRVDVSLQATASGMEASFRVDNEHLRQMLQQQLDTLKASLQAQGIHVSSLAVDIKNRDDQKDRGGLYETGRKNRRAGGIKGEDGEREEEGRLVRLDLERGLLHWVA